jgi:hypothetical protein
LEKKMKEDKEVKKRDRGQLKKWKRTSTRDLEHRAENKEGQANEAHKTWVKWT